MAVFRVNGGIINDQTLTGGMRFFKITGPFAWTVSDGSVNLPLVFNGGEPLVTEYFVVGNKRPVPNSAAEKVLTEVSKKATILLIGLAPGINETTTEIHIGVSSTACGWGADEPANLTQLPTTPTPAAVEMQAAIRALPSSTVYISVGAPNAAATPVDVVANFGACVVTEVSFVLGNSTYYTLA